MGERSVPTERTGAAGDGGGDSPGTGTGAGSGAPAGVGTDVRDGAPVGTAARAAGGPPDRGRRARLPVDADPGSGGGRPASGLAGRLRPRTAAGRYARAWAVGSGVALVVFVWLVTAGTGRLFVDDPSGEFHDTQVRAWLEGRWDVPPEVVTIEGFVTEGRTYLYFGPVPALGRLPLLAVTDALDGRLTRLSLVLAFAATLVATGALAWRTRRLVRGDEEPDRRELRLVGLAALLVGVGSVAVFYASRAWVYHETTLWAVAFTLASFAALLGHRRDGRGRSLAFAGAFAVAAMLTRASVGVAPAVALGLTGAGELLALIRARRPKRVRAGAHPDRAVTSPDPDGDGAGPDRAVTGSDPDAAGAGLETAPAGPDSGSVTTPAGPGAGARLLRGDGRRVAALVVAAILPVAAFAAVNMIKFRSPWSLPLDRQVVTSSDTPDGFARRAALADNGGTLFGLKFVPTTVVHYLRPDALALQRPFPWVRFTDGARPIGAVTFDTIDPASSVTATMPALVALAAGGGVAMARRRDLRPLVPLLGGAAAGAMTVLAFGFIAHRYLGDLLPAVLVPALAGLAIVPTVRWRPPLGRVASVAVVVLTAWSVWVNVALTLDYQRFTSPNADEDGRAAALRTQLAVSPVSAFAVRRAEGFDEVGPQGDLVVIGDCAGLYRSDGIEWGPVERTPATGRHRLRATFVPAPAGRTVPVLAYTDRDAPPPVSLHHLGDGRARMETVDLTGQVQAGEVFELGEGSRAVDLVVDPHIGEIAVRVDGDRVVDTRFRFLAPGAPLAVADGWARDVTEEPAPTPACRELTGTAG